MITNTTTGQGGDRMVDNPENRMWWLDEYGLGLPDIPLVQSEESAVQVFAQAAPLTT
jgi:hypothetical protein